MLGGLLPDPFAYMQLTEYILQRMKYWSEQWWWMDYGL